AATSLTVCLLLVGCQSATVTTPGSDSPATPVADAPTTAPGPSTTSPEGAPPETAYLFGWGTVPATTASPRGGTSRGAPVELAPAQTLPLATIASAANAFERDRAAILS